jgi:hypothetical protein
MKVLAAVAAIVTSLALVTHAQTRSVDWRAERPEILKHFRASRADRFEQSAGQRRESRCVPEVFGSCAKVCEGMRWHASSTTPR